MKKNIVAVLMCLMLALGCKYEAPLTREHSIPIDEAILGLWELQPEKSDSSENQEQILILKYSATEYLIQYSTENHDTYLRGYPVKLGGLSCVQLQIIGDDAGPLSLKERDLYDVAAYTVTTNEMVVRTLNTDLVDPELADSTALLNAFLEVREHPELFTEPGRFRGVEQ